MRLGRKSIGDAPLNQGKKVKFGFFAPAICNKSTTEIARS
jgi:hypothetical protein